LIFFRSIAGSSFSYLETKILTSVLIDLLSARRPSARYDYILLPTYDFAVPSFLFPVYGRRSSFEDRFRVPLGGLLTLYSRSSMSSLRSPRSEVPEAEICTGTTLRHKREQFSCAELFPSPFTVLFCFSQLGYLDLGTLPNNEPVDPRSSFPLFSSTSLPPRVAPWSRL